MKQAIVLRSDLGMGKGKLCAQASHASLEAFEKTLAAKKTAWRSEGSKKIVLKVASEKELLKLVDEAKKKKLVCATIRDAGFTQIPSGTITAIAIGPDEEEKVDAVTSKLKLL